MPKKPSMIIIAGPNGSGKTTVRNSNPILRSIPFVNADIIAKEHFATIGQQESEKAQKMAFDMVNYCLDSGTSFCYETVFSHESKLSLIKYAKSKGFSVTIVCVYTGDIGVNIKRVADRVNRGGHDVPKDKISSRAKRSLCNMAVAISMADNFVMYDTSVTSDQSIVASNVNHNLQVSESAPNWAVEILKESSSINLSKLAESVTSDSWASGLTAEENRTTSPIVYDVCASCGKKPIRGASRVIGRCYECRKHER